MQVTPKFCKQYSQVGMFINDALREFKADVDGENFPGEDFSPYKMAQQQLDAFVYNLSQAGYCRAADAATHASPLSLQHADRSD